MTPAGDPDADASTGGPLMDRTTPAAPAATALPDRLVRRDLLLLRLEAGRRRRGGNGGRARQRPTRSTR
jgi:hypothetical protein